MILLGSCFIATFLIPDLQPASIEKELQKGKDGDIKVKVMTRITLTRVQKLTTNQTHQEETVHCQSHNLRWKKISIHITSHAMKPFQSLSS